MNDEQRKPAALWISITVVVLLPLYVLSIGPAAWLLASGTIPAGAGGVVIVPYIPLILAASVSEPTRVLLNRYIHLWAPSMSVGW